MNSNGGMYRFELARRIWDCRYVEAGEPQRYLVERLVMKMDKDGRLWEHLEDKDEDFFDVEGRRFYTIEELQANNRTLVDYCVDVNMKEWDRLEAELVFWRQKASETASDELEKRIAYLNNVKGRFVVWFRENHVALPSIAGEGRHQKSQRPKIRLRASLEPEEVTAYVEAIKTLKISNPSLDELQRVTGIKRETWRRRLNDLPFLAHLKQRLKLRHESKKFSRNQQTKQLWREAEKGIGPWIDRATRSKDALSKRTRSFDENRDSPDDIEEGNTW